MADQTPHGDWTASPQALSTTPPSVWSVSSWVQLKRYMALELLPLGCSPSARWRFDLGTHKHGPKLALGLIGQDPK